MANGFPSFIQEKDATLHWFTIEELHEKIRENEPEKPWFRLVLLESMLFEPYYPLSLQKDKKGNDIPSKRYDVLKIPTVGYKQPEGDAYLEGIFSEYCGPGYVKRLRKSYEKIL